MQTQCQTNYYDEFANRDNHAGTVHNHSLDEIQINNGAVGQIWADRGQSTSTASVQFQHLFVSTLLHIDAQLFAVGASSLVKHPTGGLMMLTYSTIDFPLSLGFDIVNLPISIYKQLSEC